jgi:hypothetical protein
MNHVTRRLITSDHSLEPHHGWAAAAVRGDEMGRKIAAYLVANTMKAAR